MVCIAGPYAVWTTQFIRPDSGRIRPWGAVNVIINTVSIQRSTLASEGVIGGSQVGTAHIKRVNR